MLSGEIALKITIIIIIIHKFLLSISCFPSNLIAQSEIVYVSVFVLMFDKLFPQFMHLFILTMVL